MSFREFFLTISLVFVTLAVLSPQYAIANDSNELENLRALVQQMNLKMEALEQRVQSAEESEIKKESSMLSVQLGIRMVLHIGDPCCFYRKGNFMI